MVSNVLEIIQKEFNDNWPGIVQFGGVSREPDNETWIHVDVEPINVETLSYKGCTQETHAVYIIAYHRNPTQAAKLADEVIQFLQCRTLSGVCSRTWRPVTQGMINDETAFYKFSIPLDIIN